MRFEPVRAWIGALVTSLLLVAVTGCGSEPAPEAQPAVAKPASKPDAAADMVSGVTAGKGDSQVDLKFAIGARPEPGVPLVIEVALTPRAPSNQLRLIFQAADGIDIREGQDMPVIQNAAPGTPVAHRVTVVPLRDGIFSLSAVALFDSDTASITRTFVIPIIVGQGVALPDPAASPSVTPAPASS